MILSMHFQGGEIPDRKDFYSMSEGERIKTWQSVLDASAKLGDELRELVESGRLAGAVRLWDNTLS